MVPPSFEDCKAWKIYGLGGISAIKIKSNENKSQKHHKKTNVKEKKKEKEKMQGKYEQKMWRTFL